MAKKIKKKNVSENRGRPARSRKVQPGKKRPAREKKIIAAASEVRYHRAFYTELLRHSRDIIVWLPPQYGAEPERRFPVLYMHDGQNILDPATAYIGVDWQADERALKLLDENKIEPFIIVGIYNTPDRLEEYGDTAAGENFRRFMIDELKVFIDSEYRTMRGRKHTAVMGSSMGGLCAMLCAWKHPDVFGKAACLSSSFYYGNDKMFRTVEATEQKPPTRIYIDSGDDGKNDAQKMFAMLTALGFVIGEDVDYFYDTGGMHTESAWAERLERPLRFLFGKKQ